MKCYKCDKDTDNPNGDYTLKGIDVNVYLDDEQKKNPSIIEYCNKQLGKYSNGLGEVHVGICYECYVDNLFR